MRWIERQSTRNIQNTLVRLIYTLCGMVRVRDQRVASDIQENCGWNHKSYERSKISRHLTNDIICAAVCVSVCVRLPLLFSIPRGVCQMQHVKCITKPMQTIQFVAFQIESKQKAANEQTQQQHSRHVNDVNVDKHHQYTTLHTYSLGKSLKIIIRCFFCFSPVRTHVASFFPFVPYFWYFTFSPVISVHLRFKLWICSGLEQQHGTHLMNIYTDIFDLSRRISSSGFLADHIRCVCIRLDHVRWPFWRQCMPAEKSENCHTI